MQGVRQTVGGKLKMPHDTISENSRSAIDQEEYNERYNSLLGHYEDTKAKYVRTGCPSD